MLRHQHPPLTRGRYHDSHASEGPNVWQPRVERSTKNSRANAIQSTRRVCDTLALARLCCFLSRLNRERARRRKLGRAPCCRDHEIFDHRSRTRAATPAQLDHVRSVTTRRTCSGVGASTPWRQALGRTSSRHAERHEHDRPERETSGWTSARARAVLLKPPSSSHARSRVLPAPAFEAPLSNTLPSRSASDNLNSRRRV